MAMTSSPKNVLTLLLQAALIGTCVGAIANAQSKKVENATTLSTRTSYDLPNRYQQWLDEDVHWIITPEEKAAYLRLSKNEDRDRFIEQFWQRRDLIPGAAENAYKEEHYRRLAYSNEHFAAGVPGWKTDRGRIYIVYGPPDEIKTERAQDNIERAEPAQVWHYRRISGHGRDIDFRFVDVCNCGNYKLQTPPK